MKTNAASTPGADDDRLLDRLADGELDASERASVLTALSNEPDGWRRCAIAFLEAQAWREGLDTPRSNVAAVGQPKSSPMRIARVGGIAAAFIVAFFAGFISRGGAAARSGATGPAEPSYASNTTPTTPSTPATQPQPSARALELWSAAGPDTRVRLPVFTAGAGAGALPQTSALPEYVRKQLERQGYEVEGDRRVLSVALDDGRSVAVPVERLKYRYVGYRVH